MTGHLKHDLAAVHCDHGSRQASGASVAEQHTCSAQTSGNPDGCHHHYILRCTLLWTWLRSIPIFALVEQRWRFLKERERNLDGWSCFLIKDIVDTGRPRQQGCFCFFCRTHSDGAWKGKFCRRSCFGGIPSVATPRWKRATLCR